MSESLKQEGHGARKQHRNHGLNLTIQEEYEDTTDKPNKYGTENRGVQSGYAPVTGQEHRHDWNHNKYMCTVHINKTIESSIHHAESGRSLWNKCKF